MATKATQTHFRADRSTVEDVGGVVVGGGAGGGGDGVVVLAGAAGAVRRAGFGFGASTVTCGIETAGGVVGSACGVSGAGC